MSFYQKVAEWGTQVLGKDKTFKYGFNLAPMYKRSTAKIVEVSEDLLNVRIKLPISYKNRNYVNSIFGGSMFSAVDPIPMVQLINLLDDTYIVWDKSAEILFKRPAKEHLFADFSYTQEELAQIKKEVEEKQETEIIKTTELTNKDRSKTFCVVKKRIYVTTKSYYKEKRRK
ncbi:MAG: DUF4442 domain-containing protein [Bacteroidota bacterium]